VGPSTQEVRLDGRTLVPVQEEKIYILLYKPDNVVTTMKDREAARPRRRFVGELSSRVFPSAASTSTRLACSC